jgi:hypothetical protein
VPPHPDSAYTFLLDSYQNHGFSDTVYPISTPTTSTNSETENKRRPLTGPAFFCARVPTTASVLSGIFRTVAQASLTVVSLCALDTRAAHPL